MCLNIDTNSYENHYIGFERSKIKVQKNFMYIINILYIYEADGLLIHKKSLLFIMLKLMTTNHMQ